MQRNFFRFGILTLFLFVILPSCNKGISNRKDFIDQNSIEQGALIPDEFSDPRWKALAGDYYYYASDFVFGKNKKCLFILGNRKENKIVSFIDMNNFLIMGRQGEGKYRRRFITSFEHLKYKDYESMNNMQAFNSMLSSIPELVNFKWKDELQNKLMSCLLMYTQLRGISCLNEPALLEDTLSGREEILQKIFSAQYEYNQRNFLRYNEAADLFQEIKRLGFGINPISSPFEKDRAYLSALRSEFDLSDKKSLFIYYPFVSYTYVPADPEPQLVYYPAVNVIQYKMSVNEQGFPQFTRKNVYVSLLDGMVKKF
ncbi:MAG: hypothetical protein ACJ76F_08155 [Bacteroidia bacterium]